MQGTMPHGIMRLRPLEREDLRFIHGLDNDAAVMRYWFEEPYEAFVELEDLYAKHIHDLSERRFIIDVDGERIGLVELIEINHIHRRAEFTIIVHPDHQNKGHARRATRLGLSHAFKVLNLNKVYLLVDAGNEKAIHIYEQEGFTAEGLLRDEYFSNGRYRDVVRMAIFQQNFLERS